MFDIAEHAGDKTPIEIALGVDSQGRTTARKLYEFLELNPAVYSRWVKMNVLENPFAEAGTDYEVLNIHVENPLGGRPTTDYLLSASFAKKLAMGTRNERGEIAKNYFVKVEEKLKQVVKQPQTQIQVLQQAVNLLAEQEERLRAVEGKQEIINHRIDNLDMTNITGTPRQRLVSMVRKYACQNGITYKQGWGDFVSAFNTAYRTNLNWRVSYAEEQSGKKITTPEFLENVGQIEDAVRVADKMLN